MTGNIWIDLQMSLQKLRPRYPTYLTSYPAYLPWVMQWANVGLRERSTMHSTSTACLAVGARCLVGGHEAGSLMQVFVSSDDDRRAGGCAP
jgi:hypothetical protein